MNRSADGVEFQLNLPLGDAKAPHLMMSQHLGFDVLMWKLLGCAFCVSVTVETLLANNVSVIRYIVGN